MNWSVLKDLKTIIGFITSSLLAVVGVVLAINNNSYWVVFVVLSIMLSFFSIRRADKLYKQNNK
ncbi:hypothetical protein J2Y03_005772 [Neobacillus niacini]|nr:hypothetical protein [Neobacillus niacini]